MVSHHADPEWPEGHEKTEEIPPLPPKTPQPDPWLNPELKDTEESVEVSYKKIVLLDLGTWGTAERVTAIICLTLVLIIAIIGVLA